MPPNFTFTPALGSKRYTYPDMTLTLTVHLPEKYTSGSLRYFQYCCTTHIQYLSMFLNNHSRKKNKRKYFRKMAKSGTTHAPTNKACSINIKTKAFQNAEIVKIKSCLLYSLTSVGFAQRDN